MPATEEQSEQVERQEAHVQELAPADSSKPEVLEQPRQNPAAVRAAPRLTAQPRTAQRRSPSDRARLPPPHYIGEAAAAAQEAGTRRPARIPPRHTHGRTTDERQRWHIDSSAALRGVRLFEASLLPCPHARPPAGSPPSPPSPGRREATPPPCHHRGPSPSPEGRQKGRGGGGSLTEKPTGKPRSPGQGKPTRGCAQGALAPPTAACGASLRRRRAPLRGSGRPAPPPLR